MVLYFSGTGNSQQVAVQVADQLSDGLYSINRAMKAGERGAIQSDRPLVFVAPTYSWRMPKVVERWILEAGFQGDKRAYFILTCGGDSGNAGAYAERLCTKKVLRFCGLAQVPMPENYLALFPTPDAEECQKIMEQARPMVRSLADLIKAGKQFPTRPVSLGGRLESGPVNPIFYTLCVHDQKFAVSDACFSCGKCAQRCPLNNIALVDGRPVWRGNCTHCMACIGGCPAGAISYGAKSEGRHRHYIMDDTLCWGREGK